MNTDTPSPIRYISCSGQKRFFFRRSIPRSGSNSNENETNKGEIKWNSY